MGKDLLGVFEQLCMMALIRLRDKAYGRTIQDEIRQRTGQDASLGQIYVTLERLEEKGMVESQFGDATPTRGGKAKRFFALTASGSHALRQSLRAVDRMRETSVLASTAAK